MPANNRLTYGWVHIGRPCVGFAESAYTYTLDDDIIYVTIEKRGAGTAKITYTTTEGTTEDLEFTTPTYVIELDRHAETEDWHIFSVTLSNPLNTVICFNGTTTVTITPEIVTSTLYPIEEVEGMGLASDVLRGRVDESTIENMDMSGAMLSGELRTLLITYTMLDEALDMASAGLIAGELRTLLITYTMLDEALDMSAPALLSGELRIVLIAYVNYIDESLDMQSDLLTGTLT